MSQVHIANRDKFWLKDPDGVEWEVYHLNFDLDKEARDPPQHASCCTSAAACS